VRQVMAEILLRESRVTVAAAADPLIALDKMQRQRPDVIVLDLEMPRMDGLAFLQQVMATSPLPVVVCSGRAGRGTEAAFRAMEAGAVSVVEKPRLGVKGFLHESAVTLRDTVIAAAGARVRAPGAPIPRQRRSPLARPAPPLEMTTDKVIALGASTGGTEALRAILEAMPPDAPGILVVQHMPEAFTRAFAERLNLSCRIEVKEAASGDRVLDGRALIAPGNRHLRLARTGGHYVVALGDGPPVSRHRPSVDVLFASVASAAGRNAIGVILTGMGGDGADGLLKMRQAGAATVAQDEDTCVVFGMPKEAIERGAVEEVLPLDRIGPALLRMAAGRERP
jgi:two-component system, chemotaxis family, protein-glutamate methylesterase/glutaminase